MKETKKSESAQSKIVLLNILAVVIAAPVTLFYLFGAFLFMPGPAAPREVPVFEILAIAVPVLTLCCIALSQIRRSSKIATAALLIAPCSFFLLGLIEPVVKFLGLY